MSSVILQNIYSYLEVLHTAGTEAVGEWDIEALDHALKWAEYCEKIFKQSQGKPYRNDLDAAIKKFENLPITLTLEKVDLELLKDSKQLIRKVLLQNPHVPNTVYEALLHSYGDLAHNPNELIKDCAPLVQAKAQSQVSSMMLQSTSQSAQNIAMLSQAQLLLERVGKILHMQQSNRERYLEQQLQSMAQKHEGLEVMVTALTCNLDVTAEAQEAKLAVLDWLLHKYKHKQRLWDLSPSLLARASHYHPSFRQQYLSYLQQHVLWLIENDIPTDISKTVLDSEKYQKIVERFKHLLQERGSTRDLTEQFLKSAKESGQSFVWNELCKELEVQCE